MTILVVDDHPPIRELLVDLLRDEGHTVTACASGTAAWSLLSRGERFDVALVDLAMPDGDGLTLVKQIRAEGLPLRVVCCSAYLGRLSLDQRALFDDLVAKPFDLVDVLDAVAQVVA